MKYSRQPRKPAWPIELNNHPRKNNTPSPFAETAFRDKKGGPRSRPAASLLQHFFVTVLIHRSRIPPPPFKGQLPCERFRRLPSFPALPFALCYD